MTLPFRALTAGALLLLPVLSYPAGAEDLQFMLVNDSQSPIVELHVSPHTETHWTDNLMPRGYVLPSGNRVRVLIRDGRDHCEYDLRAVFADGEVAEEFDMNLCNLDSWTVHD